MRHLARLFCLLVLAVSSVAARAQVQDGNADRPEVAREDPPFVSEQSRDRVPIGDKADWIVTEDYPKQAVEVAIEGRAGVALASGLNGDPSSCTIRASSGSSILDEATCDLLMIRARFLPARDDSGKPVEGTFTTKVAWALTASRLPDTGRLLAWLIVEKDGTVSSCEVELVEGAAALSPTPGCEELAGGHRVTPPVDRDGNPVRLRVSFYFDVSHEVLTDSPPAFREGERIPALQGAPDESVSAWNCIVHPAWTLFRRLLS